jgi:hypothetical protein
MKPDWKDAPSWANYLAQDEDSEWWWFENKPDEGHAAWWPCEGESCRASVGDWRDSLEERPVDNEHETEGE